MKKLQWRDPWPSPQAAWADPPWRLTGRVVTAWFTVPWAVIEQVMSPDIWPEVAPAIRARLRFYDIVFRSLATPSISSLAPPEGRFREAVVAFQARVGGIGGEVSLFMWTDSDPYMLWGREAFGWPLVRGVIDLSGPLWKDRTVHGARGTARLVDPSGTASIVIEDVRRETTGTAASSAAPCWLTPRRVLHRGGLDQETRELLIVRPAIHDPGVRYAAAGRVTCAFDAGHPLHGVDASDSDCEVIDGFELIVGSDVEVL